jgi:hypothetical protein
MAEERTSCLYDVMTLDLETLKRLLATLADGVEDSHFTRPLLTSQVHASQYVLDGVYKKLWAIVDRYKFEVDSQLFEHQVHELNWKLVISEKEGIEKGVSQ